MALFSCVMAYATNVGTLQELKDALAVGGEITLTANISTGNAALDVNKSVAIDGQGHMLSGAIGNKGILTIIGTSDNMLEVAVSNLHIKNTAKKGIAILIGGYLDSLSVDNSTLECTTKSNAKSIEFDGPQPRNAKIGIRNSTLIASASGYPIRSYNPMNLYMVNCSTSGYCALNFQANIETSSNPAVYKGFAGSRGSKIFAENCYFDAPNVHSGGSNGFACFVFRDDGVDLTLKNCGMNAEALGNSGQTAFDLGGGYSPVERITDNGNHAINITLEGDNTHINGKFVSSYLHCGVKQTAEPTTTAQGYFIYETGYTAKYTVAPSAKYIPEEAFEGKTTVNFVVKGGTYSINPETVSFRGHVLKDQLTDAEKQQDPDNLPDSKFEQLGITLAPGFEIAAVKQGEVTLYRVVKKAAEKTPGVLYDLNDNVETAGNGQNPVTSFNLSTGTDMTLNQATTEAGYVQVKDNASDVATTVTVGTDTQDQTLVINNGLDVQGNSNVTVKPGSALIIGEGGITTEDPENIVVEANENGAASLLLDPTITVNQTPNLTVKMTVPAGIDSKTNEDVWHRFAMPVQQLTSAWTKKNGYETWLYGWNYEANDWALVSGGSTGMEPWKGYTLSYNNTGEEVYTFKGKLVGNTDAALNFVHEGYNFFGNSYTGYIDAKTLVEGLVDSHIDGTVYMWDAENQNYGSVTLNRLRNDSHLEDWEKEVAPMQTFILRIVGANSAAEEVKYADAIWGNPRYGKGGNNSAPRRRKMPQIGQDDAYFQMVVTAANGKSDRIIFTENAANSNDFESGFDADKFMNEKSLNIYSTINGENYSTIATDNLEGMTISMQTKNAVNYTISFKYVEGNEYALLDKATNQLITIEEGTTYEFSAQPNSTIEGRFQIVERNNMPTAIENTEVKAKVKGIYSITGMYLGEDFEALPAGVYVVDGVKIVK